MVHSLIEVDDAKVLELKETFTRPGVELPEKYRSLFSLMNVKGELAHEALLLALQDESALFRHDVCFCLGQRQDAAAVEVLTRVLRSPDEHAMVRHEAGEALGAIGTPDCLGPLSEHVDDSCLEVAETCQLALQKIQNLKDHPELGNEESPYYTVDPTPALPATTPINILKETLMNENERMFERYGALFALRNKGGNAAVKALGAVFVAKSALLKHEVAYVLGQMCRSDSTEFLISVLRDQKEHAMVRHEAAEALGAIADESSIKLLKEFAEDPEPIVAHSCIVALDMIEHEKSGKSYLPDRTD